MLLENGLDFYNLLKYDDSGNASQDENELIDHIFPPKEVKTETGEILKRYVSRAKPSRQDVHILQERLDRCLTERMASTKGLCEVREDLYSKAFDELIRQVALENPDRGMLLVRIRDQNKMVLDSYKELTHGASLRFGLRKQRDAEKTLDDANEILSKLQQDNVELEAKVIYLQNALADAEDNDKKERALIHEKRKKEIDFLTQLGENLERLIDKHKNASN
mmetsp:Transcript_14082/g.20820  ORF Transcript_14082/g.20820 Transcript_14082/m.20820 type:complete len:221 (+) Transcript_14082:2582-3244(+)